MKSYSAKSLVVLVMFVCAVSAFAKKDKPAYQVGVFQSSTQVSDGTYSSASCGSFGCSGSAYSAAHNVHMVTTPEGLYSIEAPISVAGTFLAGWASGGHAPTIHKAWFMDSLHEGDKVLFSAECNKHNRCTIRMPNPDKPEKEFVTEGFFFPTIAKTNATSLCGTGRLTPAVEAQMCSSTPAPAATSVIAPTPEPTPVVAPEMTNQEKASVQATPAEMNDPRIARLKVMCEQGLVDASMRKLSCDLYGFSYPGTTTPKALEPAQPVSEGQSVESLGDAAKRIKQHEACLKLAADNPSVVCK